MEEYEKHFIGKLGNQQANFRPSNDPEAQVDRRPVEAVEHTLARTHDLCSRVESIVSRLCGSVPMAAGNSDKPLSPSGLLPKIQSQAEGAASAIRAAMSELDRLERELGS